LPEIPQNPTNFAIGSIRKEYFQDAVQERNVKLITQARIGKTYLLFTKDDMVRKFTSQAKPKTAIIEVYSNDLKKMPIPQGH